MDKTMRKLSSLSWQLLSHTFQFLLGQMQLVWVQLIPMSCWFYFINISWICIVSLHQHCRSSPAQPSSFLNSVTVAAFVLIPLLLSLPLWSLSQLPGWFFHLPDLVVWLFVVKSLMAPTLPAGESLSMAIMSFHNLATPAFTKEPSGSFPLHATPNYSCFPNTACTFLFLCLSLPCFWSFSWPQPLFASHKTKFCFSSSVSSK